MYWASHNNQENKKKEIMKMTAELMEIENQEDYKEAINFLKTVKSFQKEIKAHYEPMRVRAQQTVKEILKERDSYLSPLEETEKKIKQKISQYREKIRPDENAIMKSDKVPGVYIRTDWDFRIISEKEIPRSYLIPDVKKIKAIVKALQRETNIPGIQVIQKKIINVKGE